MLICGEYKMVEYKKVQLALDHLRGQKKGIPSSFQTTYTCNTKQLILS